MHPKRNWEFPKGKRGKVKGTDLPDAPAAVASIIWLAWGRSRQGRDAARLRDVIRPSDQLIAPRDRRSWLLAAQAQKEGRIPRKYEEARKWSETHALWRARRQRRIVWSDNKLQWSQRISPCAFFLLLFFFCWSFLPFLSLFFSFCLPFSPL